MGKEYDFQKKFANMGIDKESILAIHKDESEKPAQSSASVKNVEHSAEQQEIMLLKRKVEYISNNMMQRIDERFTELEKRIDEKTGTVVEYNRDLTLLKNDIVELKRKMNNIRISFEDEFKSSASAKQNTPSGPSTKPNPAPQNVQQSGGNARPGTGQNTQNIKVEDYFNFSNKKF